MIEILAQCGRGQLLIILVTPCTLLYIDSLENKINGCGIWKIQSNCHLKFEDIRYSTKCDLRSENLNYSVNIVILSCNSEVFSQIVIFLVFKPTVRSIKSTRIWKKIILKWLLLKNILNTTGWVKMGKLSNGSGYLYKMLLSLLGVQCHKQHFKMYNSICNLACLCRLCLVCFVCNSISSLIPFTNFWFIVRWRLESAGKWPFFVWGHLFFIFNVVFIFHLRSAFSYRVTIFFLSSVLLQSASEGVPSYFLLTEYQ